MQGGIFSQNFKFLRVSILDLWAWIGRTDRRRDRRTAPLSYGPHTKGHKIKLLSIDSILWITVMSERRHNASCHHTSSTSVNRGNFNTAAYIQSAAVDSMNLSSMTWSVTHVGRGWDEHYSSHHILALHGWLTPMTDLSTQYILQLHCVSKKPQVSVFIFWITPWEINWL